jgi:hypothetical protein
VSRVMLRQSRFRSSLYSLLSRPFVCEYHTISTVPRFQPPPRRTQRADFLALRSPVCFAFGNPHSSRTGRCRHHGMTEAEVVPQRVVERANPQARRDLFIWPRLGSC